MTDNTGPGLTGIHHFSATVTDIEASAAWYQRLFGMTRVPVTFPQAWPAATRAFGVGGPAG